MSAAAPPVPMLRELLDEAIRATRALTFELSPPILYQMGLGPAIRWLAQQMKSQFGIDISVEASPDAEPQAEDLRVFLFQSVRELLMNVVKHAQSETASVTLAWDDDKLRLVVEDRGKGFTHARSGAGTAGGSGFGLFNLAERWHMLGGSFTVTARAEGGTRVVLVAPLAKSVPDAEGLREDADSARR
jgi:signal transduction histidine kinase